MIWRPFNNGVGHLAGPNSSSCLWLFLAPALAASDVASEWRRKPAAVQQAIDLGDVEGQTRQSNTDYFVLDKDVLPEALPDVTGLTLPVSLF